MTKTKDSNNQNILTLAVVALIVVVGLYVLTMKTKTNTVEQVVSLPAIENKSGLDSVSKELDQANLTTIDSELTQLNSDSNF